MCGLYIVYNSNENDNHSDNMKAGNDTIIMFSCILGTEVWKGSQYAELSS
jgi:hypothetical protein